MTLIDMDHVAESNVNRQVQALGRTLGQAKTRALAERVADIHPGCRVLEIDDFVQPDNWPALLPSPVDVPPVKGQDVDVFLLEVLHHLGRKIGTQRDHEDRGLFLAGKPSVLNGH